LRRAGYVLFGLAIICIIASKSLESSGDENAADIASIGFLGSMLLCAIAFLSSALLRMRRGDLRLRPWLALRTAPLVFLGFLALRLLFEAISKTPEYNWFDILLLPVIMTIIHSLSSTAYRRTLR
jgi:hypothetical protein